MSVFSISTFYLKPLNTLAGLLGAVERRADIRNRVDQTEIDWYAVAEEARNHRVLLQFHQGLAGSWPVAMDVNLRKQIDRHVKVLWLNARFLTHALLRALEAFEEEGIPVIAFKGPVLSDMAYGTDTMREFGDLDLFVKSTDYMYAKDILEKRGFACPQTKNKEHRIGQVHLFNSKDRVNVDLHYRLVPKHFPRSFDPNILWRSTLVYSLCGRNVTTFIPPVMLIVSSIQAFKDRWERLYHLIDMRMIIERYGKECVGTALEKACSWKVRRILLLGLALTRDVLDVALPDEIKKKIEEDRVIEGFRQEIRRAMFDGQFVGGLIQKKHRMRLMLQDKARDRVFYGLRIFPLYLHLILASHRAGANRWQLPRPFGFLNPMIQIFHLLFTKSPRRIFQAMRGTYDGMKIL